MNRRSFLKCMGAAVFRMGLADCATLYSGQEARSQFRLPPPIASARFGVDQKYNKAWRGAHSIMGDIFSPAWCPPWTDPSGDLLTTTCDTYRWDEPVGSLGSNLMLSRITGRPDVSPGSFDYLVGSTVNPMWDGIHHDNQWGHGYGAMADSVSQLGNDCLNWKAYSLTCVNGTLYMIVRRTWQNMNIAMPEGQGGDLNNTIIKSTDGGLTWMNPWNKIPDRHGNPPPWHDCPAVPPPTANRGSNWRSGFYQTMFPGPRATCYWGNKFAGVAFIHYGQDGQGPQYSSCMPERPDLYVYAIGVDANGGMRLGRVQKESGCPNTSLGGIGDLNVNDWTFLDRFDSNGMPVFVQDKGECRYGNPFPASSFVPFPEQGLGQGEVEMEYHLGLGRYILLAYGYRVTPNPDHTTNFNQFYFYEAPYPWGPFTLFASRTWYPQGYYYPTAPSKFMSGNSMWLFTAGDYSDPNTSNLETQYQLATIPVTMSTVNGLQGAPPGITGWSEMDVGTVGLSGSASYDSNQRTYTIFGAGKGFENPDGFHCGYQFAPQDATIIARVLRNSGGAGVSFRDGSDQSASLVLLLQSAGDAIWLIYRDSSNNSGGAYRLDPARYDPALCTWFKLTRQTMGDKGDLFCAYVSDNGKTWIAINDSGIDIPVIVFGPMAYVQLVSTSFGSAALNSAMFGSVIVTASSTI